MTQTNSLVWSELSDGCQRASGQRYVYTIEPIPDHGVWFLQCDYHEPPPIPTGSGSNVARWPDDDCSPHSCLTLDEAKAMAQEFEDGVFLS